MTQKFIIILFTIITLIFLAVIIKLHYINIEDDYKNSISASVLEINKVRGRPLQRVAKLSNGHSINVPKDFIPYIQIGDSILKAANTQIYSLKSKKYLKIFTTQKKY